MLAGTTTEGSNMFIANGYSSMAMITAMKESYYIGF